MERGKGNSTVAGNAWKKIIFFLTERKRGMQLSVMKLEKKPHNSSSIASRTVCRLTIQSPTRQSWITLDSCVF